uniref:ATP synthase F0 subunit 8 n=1 Tax=Epeorus gibbus TaxID=2969346 RepID=UPI002176AB8A|nr:ATP synthase F0 subunit 8 [Epeorus gibbus]UUJ36761.1 ATP synthase F0 subunit 8 [Epeorus gibbus]
MPQMAPLSWLLLFLVFSSTLILFNIVNYFLATPPTPLHSSSLYQTHAFNWKW